MADNRAVAFLDILGFKELISSKPLDEVVKQYESMIGSTQAMNKPFQYTKDVPSLFPNHPENEQWCKRYIFSDSIILIANGDDEISFLKLIVYARKLLIALISMKLPARGAVSYGELYENPTNNLVIGKSLTDAYLLEQSQDWIGVAISDEAESRYKELFSQFTGVLGDVFLRYPVPFKDGATRDLFTLNWRFNLIVEKGTRSLFGGVEDKGAQQKINNTLDYARSIVESGRIYIENQEQLPVELRSFWVGSKEPPFSHGNEL